MIDHASSDDRSASTGLATTDFDLPAQRSLQTRSWVSFGMIALVFFAGSVCGAAAMRVTQTPKVLTSLDEIPGRVANRMQRELGLSGTQRDRLEEIGRAHQAELQRIRARIAPEMRVEIGKIIDEMSSVLSPEQAARWREHSLRRLDSLVPGTAQDHAEGASP
jgi:Spy/CpxP family protein refolding chaperone